MKKILFAIAIIASSATFISCSADSISDEPTTTLHADDTGGDGTIPPIKPPVLPPHPPGTNPGL